MSATPSTGALAQAGWYDDQDNSALLRYWDGEAWTEHRTPKAQPATATTVAVKTNTKAIWSLVLSLLALLLWLTAIPGVILGFMARSEISERPNETGAGLALAGIICGFVFGILYLLFVLSYLGGGSSGY